MAALFVSASGTADGLDAGTVIAQPLVPDNPRSTQEVCTATSSEAPLRKELSSAGIMYNMAEHPKSIRAVAAKLLTDAIDSPAMKAPAACAAGCAPAKDPEIIYRVSPTVFLPEAQQQAVCLTLERDTKAHPLVFSPQEFDNVDALNSWVMEFSQGRGDDGKRLYEQCGANCSPRYTFFIAPGTAGLRVQPQVICGLARDRGSDDYSVSTAVRRRCMGAALDLAKTAGEK